MILASKKEKLVFLKECHKHIFRIYNTYLSDSELSETLNNIPNVKYMEFRVTASYPPLRLAESDKKTPNNLPKSINLSGSIYNIQTGKLDMLVSIYNEVAKSAETDESIDLNTFFSKIKLDKDSAIWMKDQDSNTLMQTHRSSFFNTTLFGFLSYFFKPKSEAFLKKYGFFESKLSFPLIEAVRSGDMDKVRALVSSITVNQKSNYGYGNTPLTIAAYYGHYEIAKILIDNGARVDSDALTAAIEAGNIYVVRLLLENGANVNHPNEKGSTPLRQALYFLAEPLSHSKFPSKWSLRVDIINEVLKQTINWNEHSYKGESIFECAENFKQKFISLWPTHENRAGLEAVCETILAAQKSSSHKPNNR